MQPTVTVILFNYNYGHYIESALISIITQTRLPDECIVMDDCSTDNSIEIIKRYQKNYPFLQLIENDHNCGINHNVLKGLNIAKGDFIWFLASDDKAQSGFIKRLYTAILEYPNIALVCSDPSYFTDDKPGTFSHPLIQNIGTSYISSEKLIELMRKSRFWIPGHTALINRKKLIHSGGFIPELKWHTDWFIQIILGLRHGIAYVPGDLAHMRLNDGTYSQRSQDIKEQTQIIKSMLKALNHKKYADIRKAFFKTDALFSLRHGVRCIATNPFLWHDLPLSAFFRIFQLLTGPCFRSIRKYIQSKLS